VRAAIAIPSAGYPRSWCRSVMRAFSPGNLVRSPAGVLLALLACALTVPSKAQAGCSPYVTHRSGPEHLARFLDPSIVGGTERPPGEPAPPTGSERPRPCSGPSCSGYPADPPAAPSVTGAQYVEPWACLGTSLSLPGLGSSPSAACHGDLRPAHASPGI